MKKKKLLIAGATIVLLVTLLGIFAPLISSDDPRAISLTEQFAPPSRSHIFGLDQNGSDLWARTLYGARISLMVAFSVVSVSLVMGVFAGAIAGYLGGWVDHLVMRSVDMLVSIPGFLLAIALVAVMGPSIKNLILALCLTGWTSYARLVRGEVLHLKEREYVLAAQALGAGSARVLLVHIIPNLLGAVVVQATFGMAGTIMLESGLSFLGLGAPPTEPTWGSLLNSGRKFLLEAPHMSLFPGLCIITLILGFNLLGDGLRDHLDPRQR